MTLEDVARSAGVSPATVSRCLNTPSLVRPALKAKVQEAIERLEYLPNGAARALASQRSRMIGAVFPSLDSTLFGGALEALQGEISTEGYTLVVAATSYSAARERSHVQNLLASGIDALVLVGAERPPEVYRMIERKGIPYVLIWIDRTEGAHPCIGFDNHGAGQAVARHLLDMGHRHIAMVSGPLAENDRAKSRLAGVRTALAERGLSLPADHLIERPFGVAGGREAFRLLMSRQPRPTAIVCGSEPFAYGAIFESQAMGVAIPGEVSVTGFDDMWLAAQITPSLTTVRTPQRQMGAEAGRYLLSRLSGKEIAAGRPLDFELVVRASSGPPPREG
ncbi:MAG: LacI family DNA-binding transcriptional regulator [Pseudomonadota bacterium]